MEQRKVKNGKLRCGSGRHTGNRMRPVEEFCKAKTPDGLSYSCKACRTIENSEFCRERYLRDKIATLCGLYFEEEKPMQRNEALISR